MLRSLWCAGLCAVWGLHFWGSAVLEGLCSLEVRVAPGSGFCLLPASISAIPAPSSLLQSPSPFLQLPFPSSRRSRPSQRCHLPAGSSPALILDPPLPAPPGPAAPSPPCPGSRRRLQHCRLSRPSCFPWDLPLMSPPKGTGFRPGDAARVDKDTDPKAGRSPARASRWNEGGNGDRTRSLVAPVWFVVTAL